MIVDGPQTEQSLPIRVNLRGPEGNALCLMGLAGRLCNELGYTEDEKWEILEEMKADDYEHLIQTLDKHFGKYIVLYRG